MLSSVWETSGLWRWLEFHVEIMYWKGGFQVEVYAGILFKVYANLTITGNLSLLLRKFSSLGEITMGFK